MTKSATEIASMLNAILDRKMQRAEDREDRRTVADIVHATASMKAVDRRPVLNMAAKTRREPMSAQIEAAQRASELIGVAHRKSVRMAIARQRAARKAQFDELASSNARPNKNRLTESWKVVAPLTQIVEEIAATKKPWAARFLGTVVDDIAQMAIEKMVLILANGDKDLFLLQQAAEQLAGMKDRTSADRSPDGRKERRELARARKWLMGMVNNRVMGALVDVYTDQRNLKWENLDRIATVVASIDGVGSDPLMSRHMADQKPSLTGTYFQVPGGVDKAWLAIAINEAITQHKLDALTELILDNLRTDGAFKWTELAEAVFLTTVGSAKWELVKLATAHLEQPEKAQAEAARRYVRDQFSWLPQFIDNVLRACDLERMGHVEFIDGTERASIRRPLEAFATTGV